MNISHIIMLIVAKERELSFPGKTKDKIIRSLVKLRIRLSGPW